MHFIRRISQTVDVENRDLIVADLIPSDFQVKVGEVQRDFFPDRHSDVPHALRETFVVLGPERGLNHPRRLFGIKSAALDF